MHHESCIFIKRTKQNMTDVKNVIELLCKHLQLSIESSIVPEHFRAAKYNKKSEEATQALWGILHALGHHIARDMQMAEEFDRYDKVYSTKLYLAFMRYPIMEFYALSPEDSTCRELLLCLGWLISTKNALNLAVKAKLASSEFGHEYSFANDDEMRFDESLPKDRKSQMKRIVSECGMISHNIKEIAELLSEKVLLTSKIHAASLNVSGLPHLTVHEVALAKKLFGEGKSYTRTDEKSIENLKSMAILLDTHMQWMKKQHVFHRWMLTVIEESRKIEVPTMEKCDQLSSFVSLVRHVVKKKLHEIKNSPETTRNRFFTDPCISRFLRTEQEFSEIGTWITETSKQLNVLEDDVDTKMKKLTTEFKKMLKSIPNCVEV